MLYLIIGILTISCSFVKRSRCLMCLLSDIVTLRMFRENVTMREEQYHLTQKEIMKLQIVNKALEGTLTVKEAAAVLGLSERQVKRLKKGVASGGPSFVIHKNRSRSPINAIAADTKVNIIRLKETKYKQANFSHFTELLAEHENVLTSRASIQRILNSAGIKSPKKHRKPKKYQRRKRKAQAGLLVQLDASPFAWLGGKMRYSLHGAIDDATGILLGLFLTKNECLNGYFALMEQVFTGFGIPAQLYSDRHTIFFVPKKKSLSVDEQLAGKVNPLTQFGRAMDELGIKIIPAGSPQAKGRIERLWGTLQSRLMVELELAGINTAKQANTFFPDYCLRFNQRFAVEPACPDSAFGCLDERINLDYILCIKEERKLDGNHTFSFKGRSYQINCPGPSAPPRAKVMVLYSPKFGVMASYQGQVYPTLSVLTPMLKPVTVKSATPKTGLPYKPATDHPWKDLKRVIFYEQSDREILEALYNSTLAWR
ncbi:MAG: ISNCY family transposase [Clostridia bacterium]|nr:ISNCY family transposase [Clostridia bacterium]